MRDGVFEEEDQEKLDVFDWQVGCAICELNTNSKQKLRSCRLCSAHRSHKHSEDYCNYDPLFLMIVILTTVEIANIFVSVQIVGIPAQGTLWEWSGNR